MQYSTSIALALGFEYDFATAASLVFFIAALISIIPITYMLHFTHRRVMLFPFLAVSILALAIMTVANFVYLDQGSRVAAWIALVAIIAATTIAFFSVAAAAFVLPVEICVQAVR